MILVNHCRVNSHATENLKLHLLEEYFFSRNISIQTIWGRGVQVFQHTIVQQYDKIFTTARYLDGLNTK